MAPPPTFLQPFRRNSVRFATFTAELRPSHTELSAFLCGIAAFLCGIAAFTAGIAASTAGIAASTAELSAKCFAKPIFCITFAPRNPIRSRQWASASGIPCRASARQCGPTPRHPHGADTTRHHAHRRVAALRTVALIVQRIERRFPKPLIWVRFPVRVRRTPNVQFCKKLGVFLLFCFLVSAIRRKASSIKMYNRQNSHINQV